MAIYRKEIGLWAIRGYSRFYYGGAADYPQPGDYDGDGLDDPAIFRPSSGLWAVRGVTRSYYGRDGDLPVARDYNGDGTCEIAIFRHSSGLWIDLGSDHTMSLTASWLHEKYSLTMALDAFFGPKKRV